MKENILKNVVTLKKDITINKKWLKMAFEYINKYGGEYVSSGLTYPFSIIDFICSTGERMYLKYWFNPKLNNWSFQMFEGNIPKSIPHESIRISYKPINVCFINDSLNPSFYGYYNKGTVWCTEEAESTEFLSAYLRIPFEKRYR